MTLTILLVSLGALLFLGGLFIKRKTKLTKVLGIACLSLGIMLFGAGILLSSTGLKTEYYYDKAMESYNKGKYETAVTTLLMIVETDPEDSRAPSALGNIYIEAAEKGIKLGKYKKESRDGNYEAAQKWLKIAVKRGNEEAKDQLHQLEGFIFFNKGKSAIFSRDFEEAVGYLIKAHERKHEEAPTLLGALYLDAAEGRYPLGKYDKEDNKKNMNEAIKWLTLSAKAKNANAAFTLGEIYLHGEVIKKDETKAFKWIKLASELGHPWADNELGIMYERGQGVEKNPEKAMELYLKNAKMGDLVGMYNVGLRYYKGEGTKQDYKKAREWFEKSARKGNPCAINDLAIMYSQGKGVKTNELKAKKYFADTTNAYFQYYGGPGVKINKEKLTRVYQDYMLGKYLHKTSFQRLVLQLESKYTPREIGMVVGLSESLEEYCWK